MTSARARRARARARPPPPSGLCSGPGVPVTVTRTRRSHPRRRRDCWAPSFAPFPRQPRKEGPGGATGFFPWYGGVTVQGRAGPGSGRGTWKALPGARPRFLRRRAPGGKAAAHASTGPCQMTRRQRRTCRQPPDAPARPRRPARPLVLTLATQRPHRGRGIRARRVTPQRRDRALTAARLQCDAEAAA
jgi:hypothetical protein